MKTIIIVILIVLGLGAGWYLWSINSQSESTEVTTSQEEMPSETADTNTTDTNSQNNLLSMIQSGESKSCTYSAEQDGNTISGVVYVSGDSMRSDYQITGENQDAMGSMIKVADTMYIWGSSTPQGIKMQLDANQLAAQNTEDTNQQLIPGQTPFDMTKDMEYTCVDWQEESTMFTPPANITFTDMTSMMETMPSMSDPEAACAMCDSLDGDNKTACLQELNCQ